MPDECNCRIGPPGSFWGCAPSSPTRSLTQRIGVFQFPHHNLAEWRATDIVTRYRVTTQSVWKLNCGVLVGGQTILSAVRLQANAGPLKAGARQTVLRSGLQRYSRHSCGIRSGVTSTRHGAIELRCRAAFVTLQSEIRPEYSKEISPGPARSTPPRWPRWRTRKAGSCGCESYGVPHAGASPPSAEPPRSRHPASVTMFARAVER